MTSLAQFLNEKHADRETILQAARYWVSEKSDDIPQARQTKILSELLTPKEFERIKSLLTEKPDLLEATCLLILSQGWQDAREVQAIQDAISSAKEKLPVSDKIILAIIAMYGMYLLANHGGFDIHQTTVRDSNGTYRQEQVIGTPPFAPVLDPILKHLEEQSAPSAEQPKSSTRESKPSRSEPKHSISEPKHSTESSKSNPKTKSKKHGTGKGSHSKKSGCT